MNVTDRSRRRPLSAKVRRVWSLVRKETHQIVRDPSSIAVGVVLPVILILVFGYGISLEVMNVPVAVVLEDPSPDAVELAAGFQLSPYFEARLLTSMSRARELMLARQVDGIVRIRPDFARRLSLGDAEVQVLVHGTDANKARIIQIYAQGAVGQWAARRVAEGKDVAGGPVVVRDRLWFNEANDSHYFLVPGLVVLVMTLIGALLTAMVMGASGNAAPWKACSSRRSRSTRSCWARQSPTSRWGWSGCRSAFWRPGFCSRFRSEGRSGCWPGGRCSTCWWRWESAC